MKDAGEGKTALGRSGNRKHRWNGAAEPSAPEDRRGGGF